MTEPKLEKPPLDIVFANQSKNESQVVNWQPRRSLYRRLIRVLLTLGVGYYLFSSFLHLNASPKATLLKHGHRNRGNPGSLAEDIFLSTPNAKSAIHASRQYAGKPHMAGTDGDFATAELFLSTLQEAFGIEAPKRKPVFEAGTHESQDATRGIVERESPSAWIDTYYPVMNTPLERFLQITDHKGNVIWNADLKEHVPEGDHGDPDAAEYADDVPTFHGLSVSGDVTGHLIYGNYCTKDDYENLVAKGAHLKGSIVLCRYGAIFRGLKVKGGQEHGAVGVLIYSDPRDDGPITVDNGYAPYPEGPARNPTSVQRGSVQFLSIYPGDPTTPGYPSYKNATRKEGTNIPSIPSLPISWDNAKQLFQVLEVGSTFEGQRVRLANHVHTRVIPIWNVIGVIPGVIKNEVVVTGNHRDAWVLGAVDPSSGTVSTHEVIRGFGRLMEKGWRPLRTIVIASWDAEEYGLIGSTEWGEDFADWIDKYVVAYFNLDSSVSGSRFGTSGSPLLAHFIRETAEGVPHPTVANKTLWDARSDSGLLTQPDSLGKSDDAVKIAQTELEVAIAMADDLGVSPLGSGSDYTVFLQRNGVPSTNEGFSSTLRDPVYHYHSVYDSEPWQERYGDPGFSRHIAIAQHLGLQIMRLANAPLLPFNTTHYSLQLEFYLDAVENLRESKVLRLDLKSLRSAIHELRKASLKLDEEKYEAWDELVDVSRRLWRHYKRYHDPNNHRHHDHDGDDDHKHGHHHRHHHDHGDDDDHGHHRHHHHRHSGHEGGGDQDGDQDYDHSDYYGLVLDHGDLKHKHGHDHGRHHGHHDRDHDHHHRHHRHHDHDHGPHRDHELSDQGSDYDYDLDYEEDYDISDYDNDDNDLGHKHGRHHRHKHGRHHHHRGDRDHDHDHHRGHHRHGEPDPDHDPELNDYGHGGGDQDGDQDYDYSDYDLVLDHGDLKHKHKHKHDHDHGRHRGHHDRDHDHPDRHHHHHDRDHGHHHDQDLSNQDSDYDYDLDHGDHKHHHDHHHHHHHHDHDGHDRDHDISDYDNDSDYDLDHGDLKHKHKHDHDHDHGRHRHHHGHHRHHHDRDDPDRDPDHGHHRDHELSDQGSDYDYDLDYEEDLDISDFDNDYDDLGHKHGRHHRHKHGRHHHRHRGDRDHDHDHDHHRGRHRHGEPDPDHDPELDDYGHGRDHPKHDHDRPSHPHRRHHRHRPHHRRRHRHRHHGKFNTLSRMADWIEAWFSTTLFHEEQYEDSELQAGECPVAGLNHLQTQEYEPLEGSEISLLRHPFAILYELESEMEDVTGGGDGHDHKSKKKHNKEHKKLVEDARRAFLRVFDVNAKLRSFERGLISKEGIKDREWFKHLGVAPGKWLGYGATTLPGLTEAIVFDKDKKAAEHEEKRLITLIKKLIKKLKV